jgi:ComF family protein
MWEEPIADKPRWSQKAARAAAQIWLGFVDFMTPPKCLLCRSDITQGASLCLTCWQKLQWIEEPVCDALGTPFEYDEGEGALSPAAVADPPPWARARAALAYDEHSANIIHQFKYADTFEAGLAMARIMRGPGRKLLAAADVIIPVPLERWRLWRRRYNQAAFLARQLGQAVEKPVAVDVLLRHRPTRSQVGLTAEERRRNVNRAFSVPAEKQATIDGKNVLLIDDVRTTGATAAACAVALSKAGAARVDVLTFALVLTPARLHISEQ